MKHLFTCFLFLTACIGYAQWTTDTDVNTLVAESGELDVMARGTSDGKTYVVFWKNVGAPVNIELRMQVMDADGNRTLGDDGILVSDQIPMSSYTVIMNTTVDAANNLYIGATGTGGGDPAYVFKMDSSGNHLWGTDGINVGSGNIVTILPLSTGGALVSWLSGSGAVMQKYDETGTAVWPATQPLTTGSGTAVPGNFFELSDGQYIAVFHQMLSGISSYLYAQRYDIDGNPVWGNTVQIADRATAFNRTYPGLQDGDVVYMGYFASSGMRFDSYLQRIDPDGTLPWGINGSDFDVNETDYEQETEIAFQTGDQYIWAVSTYTDVNQNERGEYVQKFDKNSGAREFSENAKVVFPIGGDKSHAGSLQLRNGTPIFLMEEGENNGVSPTTLHVVYLDENGEFVWPEEYRAVATFAADKSRIEFTKSANMHNVAVFVEDKGSGQKIYAQNTGDQTVGISEFTAPSIFFANPITNELHIESNSLLKTISVYNILGQQMFSANYYGENEINIDTQNWNSGIYVMNVQTDEGILKGIKVVKR